jgi:hypothetical protein
MVDVAYMFFFSTTHAGLLGLGPWPYEVGDEVWLLNGHSVPMILR